MTVVHRTAAVVAVAVAVAVRISPGDGFIEDAWRALVGALGAVGAVRLARRCVTDQAGDSESWSPWLAALLYGCGPIVMAASLRTPFDALVHASLPWVAGPLTRSSTGWRFAGSALWLALAGLGSPPWALAAVAVGLVAAAPRWAGEIGDALRWLAAALLACSWWAVGWVLDAPGIPSRTPTTLADRLGRVAGAADLSLTWSVLVLAGPLACVVAYLAWLRAHGRHRARIAALAAMSAAFVAWSFAGAQPSATPVGSPVSVPDSIVAHGLPVRADVLAAGLALSALAGLLSWVPLTAHLVPRARTRHPLATVVLVVVAGVSLVGLLYAAHERVPGSLLDHAIAGFSTHA